MALPVFSRRRAGTPRGRDLSHAERDRVPRRFEAVAEALASRRSTVSTCAVVGHALAADGVSLGEALSALRATYSALGRGEPPFAVTEALCLAWSEETLAFVGDVSCEDPLTGLASSAHLRARLTEVYREADLAGQSTRTTHALLVVDLSWAGSSPEHDRFEQALRLARTAEVLRTVFAGEETLAAVGRGKVVALVRRDPYLGENVAALRVRLTQADVATRPRIWIEGLPDDGDLASSVLAGLALL